MAYSSLKNSVQGYIYQNSSKSITGNVLQSVLLSIITSMGDNSMFMGILTDSNKPSTTPEGKQFYIGYNSSATALSINLTAVGLGTLSITRGKIYVVYCDGSSWSAVDIASGLNALITSVSNSIPTNVDQLTGYDELQHKEAYIEDGGTVTVDILKSNMAYYLKDVDALEIQDYDYDIYDLNLPATHIFVNTVADIDMTIPSGSLLRDGDSLRLETGKVYLITVKCNFWKIELYQ